jgi:alpha-L-glutamate ligase-like protein
VGIAVTELYGVVEIQKQIEQIEKLLSQHRDFVIKPSRGSGGDGIIVVSGKIKELYRTVNGHLLSLEDIKQHLTRTLSGVYSLGGQPDKALIEYRVQFDPVFEKISYLGVPDVRIIVFLGVPVMAMVRLPTRLSGGKANLHKGAIGVGIDLGSGRTLQAVWRNSVVDEHPDTGNPVEGVEVPGWDKLLDIAARCYELTGLGYQGVDLVLDKDKGPLLLELNARPGLQIQIANRAGLLPRLRAVEANIHKLKTAAEKVAFAKENFGLQKEIEGILSNS